MDHDGEKARRQATEDLRAEALSLLGEVREAFAQMMNPPVVHYSVQPREDSEEARKLAQELLQHMAMGQAIVWPEGFNCTASPALIQMNALISRLMWLLGLSDAERGFVEDATSQATDGELDGVYETLLVYADWLDDQMRTKDGAEIRRLVPQHGDVVVWRCPRAVNPQQAMKVGKEVMSAVSANLKAMGREVVCVCLTHDWDVSTLDEGQMRELGWERSKGLAFPANDCRSHFHQPAQTRREIAPAIHPQE